MNWKKRQIGYNRVFYALIDPERTRLSWLQCFDLTDVPDDMYFAIDMSPSLAPLCVAGSLQQYSR
jgi:hypothetical protein